MSDKTKAAITGSQWNHTKRRNITRLITGGQKLKCAVGGVRQGGCQDNMLRNLPRIAQALEQSASTAHYVLNQAGRTADDQQRQI